MKETINAPRWKGIPGGDASVGVLEHTEEQVELEEPKMWSITFHNDDKTGFEFVMFILVTVFKKTHEQAFEFAKLVHETGQGVVGTYPYEMAEEKYDRAITLIRANSEELRLTLDEE